MADDRILKIVLAVFVALTLGACSQVSANSRFDNKIVINIPSRTLWVYSGDKIVKWYPVGVGRPGYMTPVGKFKVIRKILHPGWEHPYRAAGQTRIPPGMNNPLGTRWIGFLNQGGGEYGMHGTDNPSSVGKFSSHGCVRLKIPDAEELFEMVQVGTPVEVVYETVLIRPKGNTLRVVVYPDKFGKGMPSADEVVARIRNQHPEAVIDMGQLRQALASPTQQFVEVGLVENQMPTVASQQKTPSMPASELPKPADFKFAPAHWAGPERDPMAPALP